MPDTPEKIRRHLQILRRTYLTMVVVAAIAFGIFFFFIISDHDEIVGQNNRIEAQNMAIQAQAVKIQHERRDALLRDCRSTNRHHDDAIRALYDLLTKSGVSVKRRKASAAPIVALINALQPSENCDALLKKIAPPIPPPPKTKASDR